MMQVLSYVVFGVLIGAIAQVVIADRLSSRKKMQQDWYKLVAGLHRVDVAGVSEVALDYLTPHRGQINLQPQRIWELLGGYEGLKNMRKNAEIMLALAAFAQRWNFAEAMVVTERMRSDAVLLRRAVRRVELGMRFGRLLGCLQLALPLHAQEASSAYYLMRQRLLALYETSHISRYPTLAVSL
jgi:hypothetical protein